MTGSESIDQVGRPVRGAQARARPQVQHRGADAAAAGPLLRRASVRRLGELTPVLLDEFLASRPRSRPRSFNHLLGVVRLSVGLGGRPAAARGLAAARPQAPGDGGSDAVHLRRRPGTAAARGGRRAARMTRGRRSAARPTATIFALCYGLGLRAGEACGLRVGDTDRTAVCSWCAAASSARAGWCRTARGSARCSASNSSADPATGRSTRGAVVHLRRPPQHPSDHRHPDVPSPGRRARPRGARRRLATGAARPAAHVRGRAPVALVSARARPRRPAASPLDVPGPRRPGLHRGVSDDHPGAAGGGQPPVRGVRRARLAGRCAR